MYQKPNAQTYTQERTIVKVLLIVVTSNRGLCGGFNSAVVKKTKTLIAQKYKDTQVEILTIGKKGFDLLKKDYKISSDKSAIYEEATFMNCSKIAAEVMESFANKTYDSAQIIYNHFKNAANQIATVEQFLPLRQEKKSTKAKDTADYIFEPHQKQIAIDLMPKYLKIHLFKAIRDSIAAEHGARMTRHAQSHRQRKRAQIRTFTYLQQRTASSHLQARYWR